METPQKSNKPPVPKDPPTSQCGGNGNRPAPAPPGEDSGSVAEFTPNAYAREVSLSAATPLTAQRVLASEPAPGQPVRTQTIDTLLEAVAPRDREMVLKAYRLAEQFHAGQVRSSGEPYLTHPLAVAHLIAELNLDGASVAAGLLHDILEDTPLGVRDLQREFPPDVCKIVEGVTKITRIKFATKTDAQTENLRKLFLAMAHDIRVVIVKFCDRLHNMRTLKYLPEERRIAIARETLDIFAPLAGRFGINKLKAEFEDSAMRWLWPEEYRALTGQIAMKRVEREARIAETIAFLKARFATQFPTAEIFGRSKHFFSIWNKMKEQGLSFDEIYDLNAVRILCDQKNDCYQVLGDIHSIWRPIPGRFKDYIAVPKKNGYQSLHTTVIGLHGEVTEVQIRTREMNRHAELGIAAHWLYKEADGPRREQAVERVRASVSWVRELIDNLADENEPGTFIEGLKSGIIDDVVLCFTPKGDVYELPVGSTPIDFAYHIHTDVGSHCVGARINNRMVNLRTEIKNGDKVEIQTSPSGHPSHDWVRFVKTPRARSKIKHWFKSRELALWVGNGRKQLERQIEEHEIVVTRAELDSALERVARELRFTSMDDLLAEIGFGGVNASAMFTRMFPEAVGRRKQKAAPARVKKVGAAAVRVVGMEETDIHPRLAACCHPVPGEAVVAFVTRGRGVTVHRQSCPTLDRMKSSGDEASRLIPAYWDGEPGDLRTVPIFLECDDRNGLLNDITAIIRTCDVFIGECRTRSNNESGVAYMRLMLKVTGAGQLEQVCEKLLEVQGVRSVERSSRPV